MYLGSRPAASVARWMARSDVAATGLYMHDCYVGWPVNHGQPVKHHVRSHCVAASSSLRDDVTLESNSNAPLTFSQDFTDYHRWPKSEFELATEEQNSSSESFGEDNLFKSRFNTKETAVDQKSRNSDNFDEMNSQQTKSLQRSCNSDNEMMMTEGDEIMSTNSATKLEPSFELDISSASDDDGDRHLIKAACNSEGREFLETELVYNRQAKALTSSVTSVAIQMRRKPMTSTLRAPSLTPSSQPPSSSSRRRVHPVSKFTNELVNWMPHVIESSSDDDEKEQQVSEEDEEQLEHCLEESNGSNASFVRLKRSKRQSSRSSRHQTKRKRITMASATRPIQQTHGKDSSSANRRRKQHNPWSVEETRMLIKGVAICGEGKWADIKRLEFKELFSRSPVDLKDKWRNLLRLAQLTQTHPRARKVEKRTDLPLELLQQVRRLGTQQK